jgi:hypothetical protein
MKKMPLCSVVVVALFVQAARAGDSPLVRLSFEPSMQAGGRDANGNLIAGTEVMHLVAHQGRLYASTSLWMEKDPAVPKACQVLVLDSPKGPWRVEHQFTTNNLRYGCLRTVTFSTDANGNGISPVELLLAAPDVARGTVEVFCRDDETGKWVPSTLGTGATYETTRAIGLHRDCVTGIDRVFAGTNRLGVIGGVYDPAAAGRIRYPDEGYMDLFQIMRILRDTQFEGAILPDHLPPHPDDPKGLQSHAFGFGYVAALIQAVNSEVSEPG